MLILDAQDAEELIRQQADGVLLQDKLDAAAQDDIEKTVVSGAAHRAVPLLRDNKISIPETNLYVLACLWSALEEREETFVEQFLEEFLHCPDERVLASWPELANCLSGDWPGDTPPPLTKAIQRLKHLGLWPW